MSLRNACTHVGKPSTPPRIWSKTLLVDLKFKDNPHIMRCLAIIDLQSDASFCDERILDYFNPPTVYEDYTLTTMGIPVRITGKSVTGLRIKGFNRSE